MGQNREIFDDATLAELKAVRLAVRRHRTDGSTGPTPTRGKGGRFEFREHTPYTPGSDFRDIDWGLFARLGELHLKSFQGETEMEIHLLFDSSSSMYEPDPSPYIASRRLAAGFCFALASTGSPVSLHDGRETTASTGLMTVRNESDCHRAVELLESLPKPEGVFDPSSLQPLLLAGSRPRLVILLSDFLQVPMPEELFAGGLGKGIDALCLCLTASLTRSPGFRGKTRLTDAETGEELDIDASPELLARYSELVGHRLELRNKSAGRIRVGWLNLLVPSRITEQFRSILSSGVLPS